MSSNFNLSFLDPALRQAILNRLNKVEPEDGEELTDSEVQEIVEQVIEDEAGSAGRLSMSARLTLMENGTEVVSLSDDNAAALGSKGFDQDAPRISTPFANKLANMGIIELSGDGRVITDRNGDPKILNYDKASELVGKPVYSWNEFYDALMETKVSVIDGEYGSIPTSMKKYLIGPMLEYEYNENGEGKVVDNYYFLNFIEIEKDFPGQNIKNIEDLKVAIEETTNHEVNGEIDEWVSQGGTGDCWLLTGVLALASTEEGRKAISDAISIIKDAQGNVIGYEVEFKGAYDANGNPIKITVSVDELNAHDTDSYAYDALSNGDNDMLLLELAVSKLEEMLSYGDATLSNSSSSAMVPDYAVYEDGYVSFLNGSLASRIIGMLTGVDSDIHYNDLTNDNVYDILSKAANDPDVVLSFGLYSGSHTGTRTSGASYSISLSGGHAFAITDVHEVLGADGKPDPKQSTVTFVNPWDSTDKITMTWEEFTKLDIGMMTVTDLDGSGNNVSKDVQYEFDWIFEQFINGNLTEDELRQKFNEIGITEINITYEGTNTIVKFTDLDGDVCTLVCDTAAINDGKRGLGGEDIQLFSVASDSHTIGVIGNSGYLAHYATFSDEEIAQYFISAASYVHNGKEHSVGYYIPNPATWPDGVSTPEDLRAYLDNNGTPDSRSPEEKPADFGAIRNLDGKAYTSFDKFVEEFMDAFGQDAGNAQMYMLPRSDGSYIVYVEYDSYDEDPDVDPGYILVTIKATDESTVDFIKLGGVESEFADILMNVDDADAVEVFKTLEKAKSGDVNALLDLESFGFDVEDAVANSDGSYSVTVSINGESYTFSFSADKKEALEEAGLLEKTQEPEDPDVPENPDIPDTPEVPGDSDTTDSGSVEDALARAKNGDVSALKVLIDNGFEFSIHILDGEISVHLSKMGEKGRRISYSFDFEPSKAEEFVENGIIDRSELVKKQAQHTCASLSNYDKDAVVNSAKEDGFTEVNKDTVAINEDGSFATDAAQKAFEAMLDEIMIAISMRGSDITLSEHDIRLILLDAWKQASSTVDLWNTPEYFLSNVYHNFNSAVFNMSLDAENPYSDKELPSRARVENPTTNEPTGGNGPVVNLKSSYTLQEMLEDLGMFGGAWNKYFKTIPPTRGETQPTFEPNLDAIAQDFPERPINSLSDLADAILEQRN